LTLDEPQLITSTFKMIPVDLWHVAQTDPRLTQTTSPAKRHGLAAAVGYEILAG